MLRLLTLVVVLGGCVGRLDEAVEWPHVLGKADDPDTVERGSVVVGAAVDAGELSSRETWTVDLVAGAAVTIEVTRSGTSAGVDIALAVYGPPDASGARGLVAEDDDAGYGQLPRVALTAPTRGEYLVTLVRKSPSVARHRLLVTCASGACAALPEPCDPETLAILRLCLREAGGSPFDAAIACGQGQPRTCADALMREAAYEDCVLGTTWYELRRSPWIVVITQERLDVGTVLDDAERARIVRAVHASSHDDVTTSAEAFARVDEQVIDRYELADVSADRRLTAYIYGAGDNTYGTVFDEHDQAIDIQDGDLLTCDLPPGPMRNDCGASSDCAAGLVCHGITEAAGDIGVCGPRTRSQVVCRGSDCSPAWLERRLDDLDAVRLYELPVERELIAYGLGDRVIAVELSLSLEHARAETIEVFLVDPSGGEQRVAGGVAGEMAIELTEAFQTTGPANGVWKLRLEGEPGGGILHGWSLRITSD